MNPETYTKLEQHAWKFFLQNGYHSTFNAMASAAMNHFPELANRSREDAILAYYDMKHEQLTPEYNAQLAARSSELEEILSVQWRINE